MAPTLGVASLVSTAGSLVIILGGLAVVAVLARRLRLRGWGLGATQPGQIKIIASRPLGAQTSLVIVEADSQRFLLGTSRAGLTVIGALDARPAETPDSITAPAPGTKEPGA
jgi:flagellar biogenesis protein FliO